MGYKWTDVEIQYLRDNYPHKSSIIVAKDMGKSVSSIYNQANKLGIKKLENTGRIKKGERIGIAHEFKKGNIPHNKGKKMSSDLYQKITKTSFKKGNIPHNHKEVGYERISKEGYVEIKIAEPNVFMLKHRYIWEQVNGTIPLGHIIIFNDGNKLNLQLENLRCISRKENAIRNSIHQYPEELKELIRLKIKLKKTIKKQKSYEEPNIKRPT